MCNVTKICGTCKADLDINNFRVRKVNKKGETVYQYNCIECNKLYQKQHYIDNKEKYLKKQRLHSENLRNDNVEKLVDYFKTHPCVDCGEDNPLVLEFDHIGDKIDNISTLLHNYKWEKVLIEIEKCEVRCANCHKIKTAKQFGWKLLNYIEQPVIQLSE